MGWWGFGLVDCLERESYGVVYLSTLGSSIGRMLGGAKAVTSRPRTSRKMDGT